MPPGIPLVAYVAAAAPLIPLLAALRRGKLSANKWILAACVASLIGDAFGWLLASRGQNNRWLSYLVTPLLYAFMLLSLAYGQSSPQERLTVRMMAGLLLLVSGVLALVVDDLQNFSRYSLPLGSLLLLAGALWSLVRGGFGPAPEAPGSAGWFWMPSGLALYGASNAAYTPLVGGFISTDRAFVLAILKVQYGLVIVAFCLIGWGILCQDRPRVSGPSSSRSSSPLRSS